MHDVDFLEGKNEKDVVRIYQREEKIVKPLLQGKFEQVLGRPAKNPHEFTHIKKESLRTLTTAEVDYKRNLTSEKSKVSLKAGEDLANIQPISNIVPRPKVVNVLQSYLDLI